MRSYSVTTIVLLSLITFFFSVITLATDCEPNDSACRLNQSQIQALQSAGIKPSQALTVTPVITDVQKIDSKKSTITKTQPYEIPSPPDYNSKEDSNSSDQNSTTDTSTTRSETSDQPTYNMFMNQGRVTNSSTNQKVATKTQQPIGIQYK